MNSWIPSPSINASRHGDRFSYPSDDRVWVAQESETIVGWISAAGSRDADAGASTGEIWAVYVAPGRWRKGIGRSLCETAERYLRLEGFIEVTLWVLKDNERAVKFYQSDGFVLDVGQREELRTRR